MVATAHESVSLWVFGYGSLIWRPDMEYSVAYRANVAGWSRRFWQGSHDHRGTPSAPGRVLTLVPMVNTSCIGVVYGIPEALVSKTLTALDYREKNGYERQYLTVNTREHGAIKALTYLAKPENPAWLGEGSDAEIAEHVRGAHGPSGANIDYVLSLHKALENDGIHDEHISAIA